MTVVGAGAVGSAAAVILARAGVGRLRLIDGSPVRAGAWHAVASAADVGLPKAEACRRAFGQILPECAVEAATEELAGPEALAAAAAGGGGRTPDLVLDCTRDGRSKASVLQAAAALGCRVLTVVAGDASADPTRISAAPLTEVYVSPVAVALRARAAAAGLPAEWLASVDAVHAREAWQQSTVAEEQLAGGTSGLVRFSLGLAAAAVALLRLAGEAVPLARASDHAPAWEKLQRGLVKSGCGGGAVMDVYAIGCVAESVWQGRSAFSRGAPPKCTDAASGMAVARWDLSRPAGLDNLVFLTADEAIFLFKT